MICKIGRKGVDNDIFVFINKPMLDFGFTSHINISQ